MSYVRVPPDGAGKKIYTKTHTVGPDSVEAQVTHIADPTSPDHSLAIDNRGSASVRFAEGQPILSGFGNLKVAQERAIGVYESSLDTYQALFSTQVASGGSVNFVSQESSEVLSVNGVSGSSARLTTNRYHYYLPGTSNIYKMTLSCGDAGKAGNTRRWGAYDDNDGLFFALINTTLNVGIRSSVSGAVVETLVPQASWNTDKLDGTGLSGKTIDITKINVFWLDYQWLGAGRVRFGIYDEDGSRITCHIFKNAGNNSLPYMRTGTLPARVENVNTSATGSSSELRSVCIGVYTEGTHEDYTFWRYADVDATLSNVATEVGAFAIRTKPTINGEHNSVVIYPEMFNVYTSEPVELILWQDAQVTGGTWNSLASAADINYTGVPDATLAQRFRTFYCGPGVTRLNMDQYFELNDEGIQTSSNGIPEIWAVTVKPLAGTITTCKINLGYKELW